MTRPTTQPPARAAHRVYLPDLLAQNAASPAVQGPEAHHALRVKRLREGDVVELFDGAGHTLRATYISSHGSKQNPVMRFEAAGDLTHHAPVRPRVEVCCPPPKPERLGPMIDQLSQIGVAAWVPLRTARTQGSVEFNRDKLERVAVESAKQCGRGWLLHLAEPIDLEHAVSLEHAVLFDASGEAGPVAGGTNPIRVLIGPEGGWTPQELDTARAAGVATRRVGPHILRVETAAVVAAATLLQHGDHQ